MNRPDPALAAVLKRRRRQRGITQENLAFQADLTISAMSRIERGLSNPTWTSVQAIAEALGIELDELGAAVKTEQHQAPTQATSRFRDGTGRHFDHSPTSCLALATR